VYADSVAAVSADGYRFTDSPAYPDAVRDFQRSFAFLRATPCDVLLTPHPDASDFWERVAKMKTSSPDAMLTPGGCSQLADQFEAKLTKRLENERGHRQ